jgi:hypothetical protein
MIMVAGLTASGFVPGGQASQGKGARSGSTQLAFAAGEARTREV